MKPLVDRIKAEPFEPDMTLEGDEGDLSDYGIEAKWIRTPGHTEGSISIVFPGHAAIVGDLPGKVRKDFERLGHSVSWWAFDRLYRKALGGREGADPRKE